MLVLSACNIVFISFIEKKGRRPFFDLIPMQELFRKRSGLREIIYPSSKKELVCKNAICNMQYAIDMTGGAGYNRNRTLVRDNR